jgi:hypothetical protein
VSWGPATVKRFRRLNDRFITIVPTLSDEAIE